MVKPIVQACRLLAAGWLNATTGAVVLVVGFVAEALVVRQTTQGRS